MFSLSTRPFQKSVATLFLLALMAACITAGGLFGFWREKKDVSDFHPVDHESFASLVFHVTGARISLKEAVQGNVPDYEYVLSEITNAEKILNSLVESPMGEESKVRFREIDKLLDSTHSLILKLKTESSMTAYENLWRIGELCQIVSTTERDMERARFARGQRLSERAARLLGLGGGIALMGLLAGILLLRRIRTSYEQNLDEALAKAMINPQTGLYTLPSMEMRVFEEIERAKRQKKKFLVLHVVPTNNDDKSRKNIAKTLKQMVRNYDLLADDNERFFALLIDFKLKYVSDLVKRLAEKLPGVHIQTLQFPRDGETVAALLGGPAKNTI